MKFRFRDFSIKKKMIVVMLVTTGIVLTLATTAFIVSDALKFRKAMVAELFTLAELVGLSNNAAMFFNIQDTAGDNLSTLKANPHIVSTHLFLADGSLFASYVRLDSKQKKHPKFQRLSQYYSNENTSPADEVKVLEKEYRFGNRVVDVFKAISFEGNIIGTVHLRSDTDAFWENLVRTGWIVALVFLISLLIAFTLATQLQKLISGPIYHLVSTMELVVANKDYSIREKHQSNDELGVLYKGFNRMLAGIQERDQELADANKEIGKLNESLKKDNLRMGAELDITRRLQQMVLPRESELEDIHELDISGYMAPADEVGGDYYDVLRHPSGKINIGIGDVTGHGLESGVLMMMVQTAIRTLLENNVSEPKDFLNILNRTIYQSVQRMGSDKNLTMTLLDYEKGKVRMSGQHEEILIFRKNGGAERVDTFPLGFMVGMEPDIHPFLEQGHFHLDAGDGFVLYTDGITEAFNKDRKMYGIDRLTKVLKENWQKTAKEIQVEVIQDIQNYIGDVKVIDDITLLIIKRWDNVESEVKVIN
ncbi:MAG: SpoIIE family protein phosphatase [Pseudomonadota bacterium]